MNLFRSTFSGLQRMKAILCSAAIAFVIATTDASQEKASLNKELVADKPYLIVPVKYGNDGVAWEDRDWLWLTVGDREIGPYRFVFPDDASDIDFYGHFPLEHFEGESVKIRTEGAREGVFELIRQSDSIPAEEEFYKEEFRPQLHFTARAGWLNDPNGLIYYNGEYHMFFQHNPFAVVWGNMSWGHAVSKDLIHWEEKPSVLFPNGEGTVFSGAAFVDSRNQLGVKTGERDPLVAFYLRTKIGLSFAYSNDGGISFTEYAGNPVLTHDGDRIDTPRPFWHEPSKRWVAPTYDFFENEAGERLRCVGIYSSANLTDWRFESRVVQNKMRVTHDSWGDELCGCVDFFQLPVDGDTSRLKWVMIFIDGSYIVGEFDGKTFFNEKGEPATTDHRDESLVIDDNYYATMTWHDMRDYRRVQVTWMMHRDRRDPGMPFSQQMTIPSELTLHLVDGRYRLRMNPIQEFETLRLESQELRDVKLGEDWNQLSEIEGELLEFEAEFEPVPGAKTVFNIRGVEFVYNADMQEFTCGSIKATLPPVDGVVKLRILLGRTSVEIYGNDGMVYAPLYIDTDKENLGIGARSYGADAIVKVLRVHRLKSIWD